MRVLHLPLGRDLTRLTKALRDIGVDATSCHFRNEALHFNADINLHLEQLERAERLEKRQLFLDIALKNFDVFHFHYGNTFLPDYSDLVELKKHGKKIVMQHLGSDVRLLSVARQFGNPYVRIKEGRRREEDIIMDKLQSLSKFIDHAIVADHELLPYVAPYYKHVHIIRPAIDVHLFKPHYSLPYNDQPLIVHAPTNKHLKGTEFILAAIERMRRKGYAFSFKLIEKTSREDAFQIYQEADIIIDQLLIGAIGVFGLEGMALGKATICYIRPGLMDTYPDKLPLINANPDTIYDQLKYAYKHPEKRYQLGLEARKYVEKHHQSHHIAKQLKKLYESL